MKVRYVVCCCIKSRLRMDKYICPSAFQSFLSHTSFQPAFSGFRGTGLGVAYQSKIKKKIKVERSHSFLSLQAKKPQQRSRRLSRGPSSHGDLSCSCVATAAAQVWLSGCLVVCGTPKHLGQCGKHRRGIVGDGGNRAMLPTDFSLLGAHSHHEALFGVDS